MCDKVETAGVLIYGRSAAPAGPAPLRCNDFEGFIEARRRLLLDRIAAVMGKAVTATGESVAEDEPDEDGP